MGGDRLRRLGEVFKERLSELVRTEVSDPRLGFITITDVVVSPDLSHAEVYVSVMGDPGEQTMSLEILTRTAGHLRGMMGTGLRLRRIPELDFRLDRTVEEGMRVESVIRRIHEDQEKDGPEEG